MKRLRAIAVAVVILSGLAACVSLPPPAPVPPSYDVVDGQGRVIMACLSHDQALELAAETRANDGMAARVRRAREPGCTVALAPGLRWSQSFEQGDGPPFILFADSDEFAFATLEEMRAASESRP